MADSAICTDRNASIAAIDASGPASSATAPRSAQAIAPHGPRRVAGAHQGRVDRFELGRGHRRARERVEPELELVELGFERGQALLERRHQRGIGDEHLHAGYPAEEAVDLLEGLSGSTEPLGDRTGLVERRLGRGHEPVQLRRVGRVRSARRRTTPTIPHIEQPG